MKKLTDKEFLERKAFYYIVNNNFDIINIKIFKLTKGGNIKVAYENNNLEDIIKLFGKNFRNNSIDTVKRKVREFIKIYLES